MKNALDKSVNTCRLREARLIKGYKVTEVAEKLNISRQLLSAYELGKISVNSEIFFGMYSLYGQPSSYYYKDESSNRIRGQIYFRKFKSSMTIYKEQAETMASVAIERVVDFFRGKIQFPKLDNICTDIKLEYSSFTAKPDMNYLACVIRERWNLGEMPIGNIVRLLEKKGFIVIEMDFEEKIDGFSFWDNGTPYIFLAKKNNAFRKRFSVAHELCHLLFHDGECLVEKLNELEKQANDFASAFLLPQDGFLDSIIGTSLNELLKCKPFWKVSVQAMIVRLHTLKAISEEKYEYLEKMVSRRHWRKNEPYDDCLEPETPVLLKQAVKLLVENNIMDKESIIEALCINRDMAEDICGLPRGYFAKGDTLVRKLNFSK